ncbi:MAG: glycosyltransferase family 39 protein, partial [Isosphaeraceae bacterium]|nr:glycosyltransferase family 39 protein [Isosphaeraceae bacterium]
MPGTRLGAKRIAAIAALSALTLGPSLGAAGRLSYHEAIWAQSAREVLARGDWLVPMLDGRPWLEKPPLGTWMIAAAGLLAGRIDEAVARAPSAIAAALLALGVAAMAARRFGPDLGLLAGLIQATTAWTVARGRLAEADIMLAALVVGAIAAWDRLRAVGWMERNTTERSPAGWRLAFFVLLGATSLAKGVGFGGALVLATVAVVSAWDRDREALRALAWPVGWALAVLIALAWPAWVLSRHPEALGLWALHVADRFAGRSAHFAGEPWWEYAQAPLVQTLPWAPLALAGARPSWRRALGDRYGPDRLLWSWALAPAALVSLASVRNTHYLIYALPPWSIWAALGLARLGERLRCRGGTPVRSGRLAVVGFASLGLMIPLGFGLLGPRLDRRGREWAFYEAAGHLLAPEEPLVLLYDDWDRLPYPTPFGPMPHDLAVRLF